MREFGTALPAKHILGNYEIFEEIGRGGMGIVYRALDMSLDRIVAIKVLRDDLRAQAQIVARFSREARAAAALDHPNIVQIFSVGSDDRVPYIAMEYIEATPLCVVTQQAKQVPWQLALEIADQLASALDCAHRAHIIHRDIKPSNILVKPNGRVYLTDFGIAKILSVEDGLTIDGSRLGTPHYMSPERCTNGELTPSSDLYSLGVVLFQIVTGRLPHEGTTSVELIHKIIADPPARARDFAPAIPENVDRLIAWLLEKNPRHRPANGEEVCDAIARIQAGGTLDAAGPGASAALADFRSAMAKDVKKKSTLPRGYSASSNGTPTVRNAPSRILPILAAIVSVVLLVSTGLRWWDSARSGAEIRSAEQASNNPAGWYAVEALCTFSNETPGVALARFELPEFTVARMDWMGRPGAAVIEFTGLATAPHQGRRVWCGLDPFARYAWIGIPPRSTLDNAVSPRTPDASAFSFVSDPAAPLAGRALVRFSTTTDGAANPPALYLWPMDGRSAEGEDSRNVTKLQWNEPVDIGAITALAAFPDGKSVAAAIPTDTGDTQLLIAGISPDGVASVTRKINAGQLKATDILASPDSRWIVFTAANSTSGNSIWIVANDGPITAPRLLRREALPLTHGSISADGKWLAITESVKGVGKLSVIALDAAQPDIDLGEGYSPTWLPANAGLVAAAPDQKNNLQLVEIRFDGTATARRQLTYLDGGVQPQCAASPNGKYAVAPTSDTKAPAFVVVDLQPITK